MGARDLIDPTRLYNPTIPAGRAVFLWGGLIYPFVVFIALGMCAITGELALGYYEESPLIDALIAPFYFVWLACLIFIALRRLKDLGKSGWYILLGIIPLVGLIFGLWLLFTPGIDTYNMASQQSGFRPGANSSKTYYMDAGRQFCPRCGAPLTMGANYCMTCGERVAM